MDKDGVEQQLSALTLCGSPCMRPVFRSTTRTEPALAINAVATRPSSIDPGSVSVTSMPVPVPVPVPVPGTGRGARGALEPMTRSARRSVRDRVS